MAVNQNHLAPSQDRLVGTQWCLRHFGVSRTTLYFWEKLHGFPASVTPNTRNKRWRLSDIERWKSDQQALHELKSA